MTSSRPGREIAADANAIAWILGSVGAEPTRVDADTGLVSVRVDDGPSRLAEVVRRLDDQRLVVDDLALRGPTLDEVFLTLTGQVTDQRRTEGIMTVTTLPAAVPAGAGTSLAEPPGFVASTLVVARRTLVHFMRTPQLLVVATVQGAMFLLIFRYVFGGAIGDTDGMSYVDFLVPGLRRDRRAVLRDGCVRRRGRGPPARRRRSIALTADPPGVGRRREGARRDGARRLGRHRHHCDRVRRRLPSRRVRRPTR